MSRTKMSGVCAKACVLVNACESAPSSTYIILVSISQGLPHVGFLIQASYWRLSAARSRSIVPTFALA